MNLRNLLENNKFKIKKLEKLVDKVDSYAPTVRQLSDAQLKQQTNVFRQRYQQGESLDSMLPEAFAVIREADKRVLGMFPYKVQIMGGIVLHQGNLAEMRTGEGKTLTETLPVYLNAISGLGVHVITVNEYLSKRDAAEMGQVYSWMGLSVGVNTSEMGAEEKKHAYACDITYTTNSELAFDYLRDNQAVYKESQVQRGLNFVIVDEADSILIDEARTPLIISGPAPSYKTLYESTDNFVKTLNKNDYKKDEETKVVTLTESGIKKANAYFGISNLYDANNFTVAHYVDEALKANFAMDIDKDYIVRNGEVMIVDTFTGRVMEGRRFSDGLHQAIEAKERDRGATIRDADRTDASITYQNFFRMYTKLAGMSGTASTEAKEFYETYHMDVITIPTNRPVQRIDNPDVLFATKKAKFYAAARRVQQVHATGQPILIGTGSVEDSEYLSNLLNRFGLQHTTLNAKNDAKEAAIVAQAGQLGAITIATNMAGRGTDIKLEPRAKAAGGLFVLGTEKFESRRIDDQLRGRAGRQGDPGRTEFFLSLEDDLVVRYGGERIKKVRDSIIRSGYQGEPLESRLAIKAIGYSQKVVEGNNFDERKNTLRYDDVLRIEREKVYSERQKVIDSQEPYEPYLIAMFARTINRQVNKCLNSNKQIANVDAFSQFMGSIMGIKNPQIIQQLVNANDEVAVKNWLLQYSKNEINRKARALVNPSQLREFERVIILKAVDTAWKDNIDVMEQLRQSITLRGYGQKNPLIEYQSTAHEIYDDMLAEIDRDITRLFIRSRIEEEGRAKDEKAE